MKGNVDMKIRDRIINGIRLSELKAEPVTLVKDTAKQINAEGAVLLENNGMLPLKKGDKVAVFGRIQTDYYKSGTGSGGKVNTVYTTNIYDSLKLMDYIELDEEVAEIYHKWVIENPFDIGEDGWYQPWSQKEMPLSEELVKNAALRNDKAIVVLGRTAGEGRDHLAKAGSYLLSDEEYDMLKKVSASFKDVCVLMNVGNVIDMKWVKELGISAVMYVWQGGQDGAEAVAEILCGKKYPSGKLSDTIVYDITDYAAYKDFEKPDEIVYSEDIFVGYRYFETFAKEKVVYPFGFGLSYTKFEVKTKSARISDNKISLTVTVKNIGNYKGKEVIQVYYEAICKNISCPSRQLIAFAKTKELEVGESQNVILEFLLSDMASYDDIGVSGNKACYILDEGLYNIYVGTDVRSAELVHSCEIEKIRIVQQLKSLFPAQMEFDRMINNHGKVDWETIKVSGETDHISTIKEIEFTGDKGIKLADVYNSNADIESFIAQLDDHQLACLSQGEGMNSPKVRAGTGGAMGGLTQELQDFGIPAICVTDGPSGLRFDNGDSATSLPNGTLLACTWNKELTQKLYSYEGMEAYAQRVDGVLGPGINIHRYPLCGRNFEYLSEDPYLTGVIAQGICAGLDEAGVSATIKHFAANNRELERGTVNMVISERALREIYLRPFEIVIKDNKTNMVMTAYNRINGIHCASNYDLNTAILREEWGFEGLVMTDWWTRTCVTLEGEVSKNREYPIIAQNDVYMVNNDSESIAKEITDEVTAGKISRGELQRNAINICNVILSTPTFERYIDGDVVGSAKLPQISKMNIVGEYKNISSGFELEINVENPCDHALEIEYSSNESELVQIPVKVYLNEQSAALFMLKGTGGNILTGLTGLYIMRGKNKIKIEFADKSVDIKNLKLYTSRVEA